jgi:hypothetical protein
VAASDLVSTEVDVVLITHRQLRQPSLDNTRSAVSARMGAKLHRPLEQVFFNDSVSFVSAKVEAVLITYGPEERVSFSVSGYSIDEGTKISCENRESECLSPQTVNETAFMLQKQFSTNCKYALLHLWLSLVVSLKPQQQFSQCIPVLQRSYVSGESASYT